MRVCVWLIILISRFSSSSFIMPTHVMYGKLVSMIEEMTDNKYRAYFYATPFDKYHVVVHDIFAPNQSW